MAYVNQNPLTNEAFEQAYQVFAEHIKSEGTSPLKGSLAGIVSRMRSLRMTSNASSLLSIMQAEAGELVEMQFEEGSDGRLTFKSKDMSDPNKPRVRLSEEDNANVVRAGRKLNRWQRRYPGFEKRFNDLFNSFQPS